MKYSIEAFLGVPRIRLSHETYTQVLQLFSKSKTVQGGSWLPTWATVSHVVCPDDSLGALLATMLIVLFVTYLLYKFKAVSLGVAAFKATMKGTELIMDIYKVISFFGIEGTILASTLVSVFSSPALEKVFTEFSLVVSKAFDLGQAFFYSCIKVIYVSICGIVRVALAPFMIAGYLVPAQKRDAIWSFLTSRFKSSANVMKHSADPEDLSASELEKARKEAQDIFGSKDTSGAATESSGAKDDVPFLARPIKKSYKLTRLTKRATKQASTARSTLKASTMSKKSLKRHTAPLSSPPTASKKLTIGRLRSIQTLRNKKQVKGGYNFGHAAIGFGIAKIAGADTKKSLAIGGLSGFI